MRPLPLLRGLKCDRCLDKSLPSQYWIWLSGLLQGAFGKSFVADSYVGTGHGFLKPGRNGYGTAEAERAQGNIDAFFKEKLGS